MSACSRPLRGNDQGCIPTQRPERVVTHVVDGIWQNELARCPDGAGNPVDAPRIGRVGQRSALSKCVPPNARADHRHDRAVRLLVGAEKGTVEAGVDRRDEATEARHLGVEKEARLDLDRAIGFVPRLKEAAIVLARAWEGETAMRLASSQAPASAAT